MSHSDVKAGTATSSTSIFGGPARVKAIAITNDASTAGTLTLKNGGSSGTATIVISTNISETVYINLPADGVRFDTNVYATIANLTRVTVFYA